MFSPSNSSTVTSNVNVFVSPASNVTLFQTISLSLTLLPSVLTSFKVVPSGTVSFTAVIALTLLLFVTVIVYVIVESFLTTSSSDVATLLASITGFSVSGVSLPSTTAAFLISPLSAVTTTVNDTVTLLFFGTSTFHVILPFSIVPSFEIGVSSSNTVPSGTISVTVTFLASASELVFVTVMLYVILLPVWTLLSVSFIEPISAVLFNSKLGFTTSILVETLSLLKSAFIQPTANPSLTSIWFPVSI